jgi:hypothetical protein
VSEGRPRRARATALAVLVAASTACGGAATRLEADTQGPASPFAVDVVAFEPGPGAGYGQQDLPGVVLGPPGGGFTHKGSEDVLSLGQGGSIVLALGLPALDGDGPDLLVFENPFLYPGGVFAEPGEVSVSADGSTWATFACDPLVPAPNGCAGYEPVLAGEADIIDPTDPASAGGDAFDLAWLDAAPEQVHFVRIVDRGVDRAEPTAGFDLDGVAVVNR